MLKILRSHELSSFPIPASDFYLFNLPISAFRLPPSTFPFPFPPSEFPNLSPRQQVLIAQRYAPCPMRYAFASTFRTPTSHFRFHLLNFPASQPPCFPAIAASQKAQQAPWFWLRPVRYILLWCRRDAPVVPCRGPDVR